MLIGGLNACAIWVLLTMSLPASSRLVHIFSSFRFNVSGFMLRYLTHLELISVQGDKYGTICISCSHPFWTAPFVGRCLFSSVYFWFHYQKLGVHRFMDLFLSLQIDSIGQHVFFYANII